MRLSPTAQQHIEEFMRARLGEPALRFPLISLHAGPLGELITRTLRVGAITFGRRIIVSPRLLRRDAAGRLTMPGWLLAHEATHVMQYERAGMASFLVSYLREYFGALFRFKKLNAWARIEAYRAISLECEAREAEAAYRTWLSVDARKGQGQASQVTIRD